MRHQHRFHPLRLNDRGKMWQQRSDHIAEGRPFIAGDPGVNLLVFLTERLTVSGEKMLNIRTPVRNIRFPLRLRDVGVMKRLADNIGGIKVQHGVDLPEFQVCGSC
ncbi:hypothetical protein SRABI106_04410 [Rahnella aquatilis]|nr:hypothetical protein SRABI106_04410 [Rahnella aquatilis]